MNDLLSNSMRVDNGRDFHAVDLGHSAELATMDSGGYLKAVYDEAESIRKEMAQVKELLVKLQRANEESKTILKATAMKVLRNRMDKDIEAVSKTARSIKQRLDELEKKNLANRKNRGCEEGTSTDRACTSIVNAERKKLKDVLEGFQVLREKIMSDYKETVERRYFTVTGERADDATIEHIIDTGESETFLQKAIQEQGRGHILETIKEIQERHDAVKDIEKSLLELHEIFVDMAVLVDEQGATLNNIHQNVLNAVDHVASGTKQLASARKSQKVHANGCVGVLLLDGSRTKVLIGRRKSSLGHNTFALPGGHLDFGETWEECAAREVMEETGLAIHNVKFAHVVNTVMRDEKRPAHYVTIFMRAELVNSDDRPRNMEPDKCDGWEWAEWPHLPQPVFRPLQTLLESGYNPFT